MRLLFTPLVRALQSVPGDQEFPRFLDSFRYPLSGEVCLGRDLLGRMRVPSDWGVEAGMLAEVSRLCSPRGVCQVDIAESYDHKHQDLSASNPRKGLNKMACDIALLIFRTLAGRGVKLDAGLFDALQATYMRKASDAMRFHWADAEINQLHHDRLEEELAVATFARSIRRAARAYLADPLRDPMIPNWNRIDAGLPGFAGEIAAAVRRDCARRAHLR
jgi:glucosyl-3-phosphoglycerate synthase